MVLPFLMDGINMSYVPIPFVDDIEPFLEADNMNHMQQGIVLAVTRSTEAKDIADEIKDMQISGALNGKDGVDGKNGSNGLNGRDGVDGKDGHSIEIFGYVESPEDLPDPTLHNGEHWVTTLYGFMHESVGGVWLKRAPFVGTAGKDGKDGRGGFGFGNDGFNNRGNWGGEGCVTPSNLSAQLANVTDTQMNTTVLQTLGDIKASVPLAEGQVQLALAGATSDINSNISAGLQTAINGQAAINKNVSEAIASSLASQSVIKETILTTGSANLQATAAAQFQLSQAIAADGAQTRALIQSIETANTQRLLGERQDQINELLSEGRRRDDRHGIEINMTNNQNQQQLQFQAQQQQIASLTNCIATLGQNIQATNQAINIGGFQQANPTNTNTNVRA